MGLTLTALVPATAPCRAGAEAKVPGALAGEAWLLALGEVVVVGAAVDCPEACRVAAKLGVWFDTATQGK